MDKVADKTAVGVESKFICQFSELAEETILEQVHVDSWLKVRREPGFLTCRFTSKVCWLE